MTLVYSTGIGKITKEKIEEKYIGDGYIRLFYEKKGRKTTTGVIVIKGIEETKSELKKICSLLKKKLGCGGTVEGFDVIIQSNNKEAVKEILLKINSNFKIKG